MHEVEISEKVQLLFSIYVYPFIYSCLLELFGLLNFVFGGSHHLTGGLVTNLISQCLL